MLISNASYSQMLTKGHKPDPLFAKYCLKYENYYDGLHEFKALLKEKPNNDYYRWGVGYCILHLNKNKSEAIPYFLEVLSKDNADLKYYYDLGEAYMLTCQFDKAIDAFNRYILNINEDKHDITARRMLEMIENAKKAIENPINVEFVNLGTRINTEYPDFNPLINSTEKYLVYTKQTPTNIGRYRHEDGYYAGDIYYSNFKFGKWKNNKRFSSIINTKNIEIGQTMSSNAASLIVFKEDIEKHTRNYLIYKKRGRYYGFPQEIKIDGFDIANAHFITISPNNKYIVFSAINKDVDKHNLDLYFSKLSPDGFWMIPQLLDSNLNTIYDESYPYFSPDMRRFYFASKGHNSMGGYDIFECSVNLDSLTFGVPKNIGYPVNTTMNDKMITFNNSGRYAYKACLRDEGLGDLDIYRIIFKDRKPLLSYIHGYIFNQDSVKFTNVIQAMNQHIDTLNFPVNREYKRILLKERDSIKAVEYLAKNKIPYEKLDVKITALDSKSNKEVGKFIVKEKTASYAIILPPGEYKLIFSRKNFQDKYYTKFVVEDFDLRNRDIEMQVLLKQK